MSALLERIADELEDEARAMNRGCAADALEIIIRVVRASIKAQDIADRAAAGELRACDEPGNFPICPACGANPDESCRAPRR